MNKTTNHFLQDVDSLHFGCEDAQSREYDWSRNVDQWESWEAEHLECGEGIIECDQCDGGQVDQHDENCTTIPCDVCDGSGEVACDFEGSVVCSRLGDWTCPKCGTDHEYDGSEGPMMNYYYPLPDYKSFSREDAAKLDGLPLALVHFSSWGDNEDESLPDWALALTGGGMDLSWQIAEAHMRLGLLPPLFTCRLPKMAGMDMTSPVNAWIIAGCKRTVEAVRDQAQSQLDYLNGLAGD